MAEKLIVTIRTDPPRSSKCVADHFIAKPGSTIEFVFPEFPDADLVFDEGSPFSDEPQHKIKPGRHKVKMDVRPPQAGASVRFSYKIQWLNPPGSGNGTGEVIGAG